MYGTAVVSYEGTRMTIPKRLHTDSQWVRPRTPATTLRRHRSGPYWNNSMTGGHIGIYVEEEGPLLEYPTPE